MVYFVRRELNIALKYFMHFNISSHQKYNFVKTFIWNILDKELGETVNDFWLYLTRTLRYSIHKSRNKLLGKWNIRYGWMILC